jgi:hypothetical protein
MNEKCMGTLKYSLLSRSPPCGHCYSQCVGTAKRKRRIRGDPAVERNEAAWFS